jgi:hypothetical protein
MYYTSFFLPKLSFRSTVDTTTGEVVETRAKAHEYGRILIPKRLTLTYLASRAPINRAKCLMPWMLSTGDDDGIIKVHFAILMSTLNRNDGISALGSSKIRMRPIL